MKNKPLKTLLRVLVGATLVSGITVPASALTLKGDDPIEITANNAVLDEEKKTSTYTGNVVIIQGDSLVEGDRVVFQHQDNGDVIGITATGQPAHIKHKEKPDDAPVDGYGLTIIYTEATKTLQMKGNAKLIQNKNTFSGKEIDYDTEKGLVKARGGASSADRVKMVIHPKKKD